LGPRQTTAEERLGSRKPRDMRWREPIAVAVPSFVSVGGGCEAVAPFVLEASPLLADKPLLGSEGGMGARSCDA